MRAQSKVVVAGSYILRKSVIDGKIFRNYNPKDGRGSKKPVSREEAMEELLQVVTYSLSLVQTQVTVGFLHTRSSIHLYFDFFFSFLFICMYEKM